MMAVFVHGLFSSGRAWQPLLQHLTADPVVNQACRLECFEYSSPRVQFRLTRCIPQLSDVADQLRTWIRTHPRSSQHDRLVLIGHSFGGLVIQKFIANELVAGRGASLKRVRAVVLLAVPNTGTEILISARRFLGRLWKHPHEQRTRPFDAEVESMRRVIMEQCVYAKCASESRCPIPFHVFAGSSDGVVPVQSARSVFPEAGTLPGDHSGILRPGSEHAPVIEVTRRAIIGSRSGLAPEAIQVSTEELDVSATDGLLDVVRLQHDRFPHEAHMDVDDLRRCLESYEHKWSIRPHLLVARVNQTIEGFILFSDTPVALVAGYIAVSRGNARELVTRQLIDRLQRHSRDLGDRPVVFEVHKPQEGDADYQRDLSRVRLFERHGARVIHDLAYSAPDMGCFPDDLRFAEYLLMYGKPCANPEALDRAAVASLVQATYQISYGLWYAGRQGAESRIASLEERQREIIDAIPSRCFLRLFDEARAPSRGESNSTV